MLSALVIPSQDHTPCTFSDPQVEETRQALKQTGYFTQEVEKLWGPTDLLSNTKILGNISSFWAPNLARALTAPVAKVMKTELESKGISWSVLHFLALIKYHVRDATLVKLWLERRGEVPANLCLVSEPVHIPSHFSAAGRLFHQHYCRILAVQNDLLRPRANHNP